MKCKNCNINEAVKYSQYSSGEFCSKSCSASFSTKSKRKEINAKVSFRLKQIKHRQVSKKCPCCKQKFEVTWKYRKQKFCSKSCNKKSYMNKGNVASVMGRKSVLAQNKNRRSKNEIYFGELCKQKFNSVKFNEAIFNGWDADIIIEDLKLAVLWNGKWHYEKITEQHSVSQVQNRDKIKQKEIVKSGYKPYVIKDLGKWKKSFVEEKFIEMLVFLKLSL